MDEPVCFVPTGANVRIKEWYFTGDANFGYEWSGPIPEPR